jgi:hypothetical protein
VKRATLISRIVILSINSPVATGASIACVICPAGSLRGDYHCLANAEQPIDGQSV